MKMSKKGISPLVATILLIAFAIALGAVVMSWGKDHISTDEIATGPKAEMTPAACNFAAISIKYGIGEKPCFDSDDGIFATFIDNGQKELTGIKLVIYGSNGITTLEKDILVNRESYTIAPGDSVLIAANYGASATIDKVEIVPKVMADGKELYCSGNRIELSGMKSTTTCFK